MSQNTCIPSPNPIAPLGIPWCNWQMFPLVDTEMYCVWGIYTYIYVHPSIHPSQRWKWAHSIFFWLLEDPGSPLYSQAQQKDWATASVVVKAYKSYALKVLEPCKVFCVQEARAVLHGLSHWQWFTQIFFKASKFIAIHFLIAFTMEIVQIYFELYSIWKITKLLISFAIIYEDLY